VALREFELIGRFFDRSATRRSSTRLAIGDDCALLRPEPGVDLAVTVDTLVEGVHFFAGTSAEGLGHKALAVNLSDLAAMGAQPAWVTLALTLPQADEGWLARFSKGFFSLAERYGVDLVGGDTTRGPLSITIHAMGFVDGTRALRRSAAKDGDGIYLTGELGSAGLGLKILRGETDLQAPDAVKRLERPEPRVRAGLALAGLANACIDVSDGLAADLGHVLDASGVGATLEWSRLPFTSSVHRYMASTGDQLMPLYAGDDYELCFTVAPEREDELARRSKDFNCSYTRIGRIERLPGLRLNRDNQLIELSPAGYQHF
jgi:thiamine-monophosphate kinase